MRYYNENPQVTLWKEKAERLQKDYDTCLSLIERLKQNIDLLRTEVNKEKGRADSNYNIHVSEVRYFNSLPWYKKMFYKFWI